MTMHTSPEDRAVIGLLGQERYDRLHAAYMALRRQPTKARLSAFTAIVEEMPAEQRAAVHAAVRAAMGKP